MPDLDLATQLELELARLTPRARAFALAVGSGRSATEAAREARLSEHPHAMCRQKQRVEPALRLLREQARRSALLTLESAVERFQQLSEEARQRKDFGAAARSLREACLLLGLYPSERVDVTHRVVPDVTAEEWEALALLKHGVRALPAVAEVDAEVVPIERAPGWRTEAPGRPCGVRGASPLP